MRTGRSGWWALGEWSLSAAAVAIGVLSMLSIGVFILPPALGVMAVIALRNRPWPEGVMGALIGAGGASLLVAYLNRNSVPCPPSGGPETLPPGVTTFSCGGFDPVPWLVVGTVLVVGGVTGYAMLRQRSRPEIAAAAR